MMRAAGEAASTAIKSGELAVASAEVIAARLSMIGPSAALEASMMVPEKAEAFAASGAAMAGRMSQIAASGAQAMAREGAKAAEAGVQMALAHTPADLAAAQSRYLAGWFARATSDFAHWTGLAVRAQAEALAPVHKTATDNARRLRR
jgi:hypothetical protein